MTEMKRQLRKIAETWENNNGTTGFAEFICWKGSDGKKKTSAFYEKEEEILDELFEKISNELYMDSAHALLNFDKTLPNWAIELLPSDTMPLSGL